MTFLATRSGTVADANGPNKVLRGQLEADLLIFLKVSSFQDSLKLNSRLCFQYGLRQPAYLNFDLICLLQTAEYKWIKTEGQAGCLRGI